MASKLLSGKSKGGTPGRSRSGLKKLLRFLGIPFAGDDSKDDLKKLLGKGEAKRSITKLEEARRKRREFLENQ